jgi:prepilin-type N-terminal cleavage/methylation domain-containing protein
MKIKPSNKAGFTFIEIMILVAIIGLLATITIPNFVRGRKTSQANACINNLRQIDCAIQTWALETQEGSTAIPNQSSITPYLCRGCAGAWPTCPANGAYTINQVSSAPTCNIANHVLASSQSSTISRGNPAAGESPGSWPAARPSNASVGFAWPTSLVGTNDLHR